MNFDVRNFATIEIFGIEVWITESLVNMWIIMAILIIAAAIIRITIHVKRTPSSTAPRGVQNAIEAIVEVFDRFVRGTAGDKLAYLGHWFFAVFAFIMFSNFSGVFIRPPTADWAVTFTMAFASFLLIQYAGIRYRTKSYLLGLLNPLNLLGEVSKPVALSFRLFGNILGGTILIGMLYGVAPSFAWFGVPVALHAYFDIAMGFLQTYIFIVLSMSFVGLAVKTD